MARDGSSTPGREVRALALSPDGQTLAAAGADGRIRRYAGPDWERTGAVLDHGAEIRDLAWSGDGSVLASAGRDLVVRLWEGDEALAALSPHGSDVRAVAFVAGDRAWCRRRTTAGSGSGRRRRRGPRSPAPWPAGTCTDEEWDRYAPGVERPRPALC